MRQLSFPCLVVVALAAAACGDDESTDTSSSAGGGSSTSSATTTTAGSTGATSAPSSSSAGGGEGGAGEGGGGGAEVSPAATIESDDGTARLILEQGALPAGVSIDDITITALSQDEAFESFDAEDTYVAGYELGPDGLVFEIPPRFEVEADIPSGALLLTGLLGSDADEFVDTDFLRDEETGLVSGYALDVPHFSRAVFLARGTLGEVAVRSPLRNAVPGGPTSMSARVTPILFGAAESDTTWKRGEREFRVSIAWESTSWDIRANWFGFNLAPQEAFVVEAGIESTSKTYRHRPTCIAAGGIQAYIEGEIRIDGTVTLTPLDGGADETALGTARSFIRTPYSDADCIAATSDATDDLIDSISTNAPTYDSDEIDLTGYAAFFFSVASDESNALFEGADAVYPCGESSADGLVVCAASSLPMPETGEVLQLTSVLAAEVPVADDGHSLIYSVVLDSDDLAANDWIYNPPYDWDLFRGADRWYQLVYDHIDGDWSVTASQVATNQSISSIPTTARAIVQGASVTWLISADEFASAAPGYRTTAFGHDGSFSPADRGADVSGADPTEPLSDIE